MSFIDIYKNKLSYQNHFKNFKFKNNNILEIGVGGYEDPYTGGNSLRMWKSYFPFSKIYALDIHEKSFLQENKIKIFNLTLILLFFFILLSSLSMKIKYIN